MIKMKLVVAVIFVFICATGASRNWAGVPKTDLTELDSLLKDTKAVADPAIVGTTSVFGNLVNHGKNTAVQNNHESGDEGSGVNPFKNLADAVQMILPKLKELKDARDNQSHEFGKAFIGALKNESDDNKVKALFGKHIRTIDKKCIAIKLKFAKAVHESGLFQNIQSDKVDFVEVTSNIIKKAGEEQGDVFDAFVHVAEKHGLKDHPGVQLLIAIGSLVADAGCDQKLDGYIQSIGKLIKEHNAQQSSEDEDGYYGSGGVSRADCTEWKVMFHCIAMPRYIRQSPANNLEKRGLTLLFDEGCSYKEGHAVKFTLEVIKDAFALGKKVAYLKFIDDFKKQAMISKFIQLHHQSKPEEADVVLANYVLGLLRKGMLTSFFLPEYWNVHHHGEGSGEQSGHGEGSGHQGGGSGHQGGGSGSGEQSGFGEQSGSGEQSDSGDQFEHHGN